MTGRRRRVYNRHDAPPSRDHPDEPLLREGAVGPGPGGAGVRGGRTPRSPALHPGHAGPGGDHRARADHARGSDRRVDRHPGVLGPRRRRGLAAVPARRRAWRETLGRRPGRDPRPGLPPPDLPRAAPPPGRRHRVRPRRHTRMAAAAAAARLWRPRPHAPAATGVASTRSAKPSRMAAPTSWAITSPPPTSPSRLSQARSSSPPSTAGRCPPSTPCHRTTRRRCESTASTPPDAGR